MSLFKPRMVHLALYTFLVAGASSFPSTSKAEEIDLTAVTASIVAALNSAEEESRIGNDFVLPLRTNEELAQIMVMCEMAATDASEKAMLPEICGDVVDPIDSDDSFMIEAAVIRHARSG